ncbi:AGAP009780-PA, partial [Anopheles gambiae str. PEST]
LLFLFTGQVELENLPLRKDALRHFGLPLQIVSGTIGKVKLTVPVRAFRTASWCLYIDNVQVTCRPIDLEQDWNAEVEQQTELDLKVASLDRLEAKWRAQRETPVTEGSYYASSYSGWLNYGTTLVTNIIENLQLTVNGIHVRYEDGLTIPHQHFACGIKIDSLSAQSCDASWTPGKTANWSTQHLTFKLVELTNFSMYWDPRAQHEPVHMISPISVRSQLRRDRSETPLRTRSRPRLVCDLIWDEIRIALSDIQYNQMMQCVRGLDDIARYRRFKLQRPTASVGECARDWWRYAVRCHGLCRHLGTDPYVIAKENMQYIRIYMRLVANPNEVLTSANKQFKDRIERDRTFDELRLLRDVCMMQMPKLEKTTVSSPTTATAGKSLLVHYFPQWWYSKNNNNQTRILNPVSSFEDEILDALAGSVESNSLLKRDAVFGKFNFILKRGTLDFCSSVEMAPKLQFLFQDLKMDVESRPRSGSHYVGLSLGSILIKDRLTPNSQFPDLVKPQQKDELNVKGSSSLGSSTPLSGRSSGRLSTTSLPADGSPAEPIFQLQYERKPLSYDTDYRLMVKSESLDIVYNMDAVRWLVDFLAKPHQQYDARRRLEDMKNKTKQELMKNWNYIIEGHLSERKTWTLEFDISAPQIIFVDNFSDRINSTIVVVDFGRLQLTNGENGFTASSADRDISPDLQTENDEEDAFMTPCSTPPGSEASTTNSPTLVSAFSEAPELTSDRATTGGMVTAAAIGDALDEYQLYQRLYDRYHLQLTDLQVLVCHAKERWTAASLKSTSNLHVLDRFSIVLQVERRVVYTSDPQYPSLTLSGTLPKLNAHINEYKVSSILTLANKLSKAGQAANLSWNQQATSPPQPRASSSSSALGKECGTNIVVFQFTIDQMSLEVQSRGRSVAELQVSGVKAGYSQRPEDISLTLSVHGLLLVDAMQSFGQDFELLIASHRHYRRPTSPLTISKALSNLQRATSPTWNAATMGDLDALITVEIVFVTAERPEDKLQVANIQFNNLDIIANQETIVELLGFIKRVIPVPVPAPPDQSGGITARRPSVSSSTDTTPAPVRLEITFDFHRLNVLVLRALIRDNYLVGRKVGTFTMSEAKIHATLGSDITVEGSLGGLQVLDLTPEGVNHQRILSVGKDPLTDTAASVPSARFDAADSAGPDLMASLAQEVYGTGLGPKRADHHHGTTTADGMHEERQALSFCVSKDLHACIDIRVKMASVWFIHCARFMQELSWCATEFKHYLKNLARSIREKATDMALGLVQSRSDLTGSRPESIYASPRRVRRQRTVDITLDTPVLILPRSSSSPQVLVAHLGRITVSNTDQTSGGASPNSSQERIVVNLSTSPPPSGQEEMGGGYLFSGADRTSNAIPIIHDTIFSLEICREQGSDPICGDEESDGFRIVGCVVKPLRLSLKRQQYEQLLETIDNLFKIPKDLVRPPSEVPTTLEKVTEIAEDGVSAAISIRVHFELPAFIIQLNGNRSEALVQISFRDFCVDFDKRNQYETHVKISLRSLLMEDLLQSDTAKNRYMVVTSAERDSNDRLNASSFASHSCPNPVGLLLGMGDGLPNSLPTNLEDRMGFSFLATNKSLCPDTPPPSPSVHRPHAGSRLQPEENLVIYSSVLVDPSCPTFATQFGSLQQSSLIDFNSLDLIVSVESWFVLLDFFGLLSDDAEAGETTDTPNQSKSGQQQTIAGQSKLEISVRSLSLVLAKPTSEIAKANVSNAQLTISKRGQAKQVEGSLGSITLSDLTPYGTLYREKFMTTGSEALSFKYVRDAAKGTVRGLQKDAQLTITMSSVRYTHTKRFIAEIQLFFKEFSHLQTPMMRKIKPSDVRAYHNQRPTQLGLAINAGAPIILLPMSYNSDQVIVADLGEFTLTNEFRLSALDREVLDVMHVNLFHTDIFAARMEAEPEERFITIPSQSTAGVGGIDMKGYRLVKKGPSLLKEKCHLKLEVERNLDSLTSHFVPDITVHGKLTKLDALLDLQQYRLIRGFLSHNLGEPIDELYLRAFSIPNSTLSLNAVDAQDVPEEVWKNLSINLELLDVSVRLVQTIDDDYCGTMEPLACVNFIKSKLLVDCFSDGAQDIDLVSQQIQLIDTRFLPSERQCPVKTGPGLSRTSSTEVLNVFPNILQPIRSEPGAELVQAEIHSRRRKDLTKFTILLNNMRLMAILDWLENARDFILQQEDPPPPQPLLVDGLDSGTGGTLQWADRSIDAGLRSAVQRVPTPVEDNRMELKLNITDSELVFVEKTDQHDTNAVILKSTTVVSYRPFEVNKTLSINLNNLEVFSCILGAEERTALSIIDPVTINMDVKKGVLEIQMQKQLCIRLSYHDVRMFRQMLESLPKQTKNARDHKQQQERRTSEAANSRAVEKLIHLGFRKEDCLLALERCSHQLDEAALWLTQNKEPPGKGDNTAGALKIIAIEMKSPCISICVIDDCRDADVPLVELSLSKLDLRQELGPVHGSAAHLPDAPSSADRMAGVFAVDYYNRVLSGWEPMIESWKLEAKWGYSLAIDTESPIGTGGNRLNMRVESNDTLRLNITSTLIELFALVKDNWMQDYYVDSDGANGKTNGANAITNSSTIASYRQRAPFIPFAIKNDTGVRLWYTTLISSELISSTRGRGGIVGSLPNVPPEANWTLVEPGGVATFSYGTRNKARHRDSHKMNLHQIAVRVEGWQEVGPVSVDRVGTYFRHARPDMCSAAVADYSQMPRARIVFGVTMEGSAQKLITVRSALKLINKLDLPVLVKMEHLFGHLNIRHWPETKTAILHSNELLHVPLTHVHAVLYFRPLLGAALDDAMNMLTSSAPSPVPGSQASSSSEGWTLLQRFDIPNCRGPRDKTCKMLMAIRKEPYPSKDVIHLPGHVITIFPPMRIHNLLPCELLYRLPSGSQGRISSSDTARITEVDIEQPIALSLTLDSYPNAGQITIPAGTYGSTTLDVRLFDMGGRMLKLSATIVVVRGRGVQISIGAPYWLVNRTGLPLVFRQDDLDTECAGQFSENEEARMITPFMFAFSDPGCSGSVTMRLGRRFGGSPNWCQPFKLEQGTQHRQLRGPSETFIIGIEVRRARGKYGQTSIVTFSPRYQLYNRSSYTLQVLQKCLVDTTTVYDPTMVARSSSTSSSSSAACIEAVPGCHIPFHWPRLEREHELCVRLPEVPECLWSGGIPITSTGLSLYINIRNMNGAMHFLRLETILHGATYFMIFSDAQALPPPIRLDNYSHVPITFAQADMKATFKTVVRPQCSIAYVLDEPTGAPYLQLEAPGGDYSNCRLDGFEPFRLMYENFIYIAFSQTFETGLQEEEDGRFEVRSQQLVLGVVDGRVLLVRKQAGDRSQLWRMNNEKQLEHEGTSPPSEPGRKQPRYVLDLEKPPQPMQYIALVVRPANRQRRSTQTWHFTEDGRLMCEHSNMCVQARGGFFGLRAGSEAVLGMCVSDTKVLTQCGVPYEQAIERQKLRPGSGCLSVSYRMDGPIKSIQIRDVKAGGRGELTLDSSWKHVSHIFNSGRSVSSDTGGNGSNQSGKDIQEYHVQLKLRKGIGLSLISNQPCEELAYVTLENIHMECIRTPAVNSLDFSVGDMQIDNQLFETSCPIMLYTIGGSAGATDQHGGGSGSGGSSLQLNVKQLPSPNTNAVIFEHFIVSIRPVAVYLEERLFLRMVKFFGFAKPTVDPTTLPDETDYEAQKIVYKVLDSNVKRYYFGDLRIIPAQIRLSFVTASKLTAEFAEIKRNLGFTFIKFEDAVINFEQFAHKYHFETMDAYVSAIKAHYKQELKWQAASILGSVDFLGNPLGFANDLSEGFSGLLLEGSISSLVKNVTHGISNSTAKLTETISDGLGKVVFDDEHVETRQRILDVSGGSGSGTTGDHLVAGFRGFTFGLLGGVTSIVKHTYQGTASDGLSGFITGLGKGLVGTVTKPVIGVLDLASETANAVREQSKGSNRILPERKRPPRTVTGAPGGLLPPYSYLQSTGQQYLFLINKRNFAEQFMAYEPCLLDTKDSKMRLLVSAENVWGFSKNDETTMIVFNYPMSEIISCQPLTVQPADLPSGASQGSGGRSSGGGTRKPVTYIEFCLSLPSKSSLTPSAPEMVKRPRVRCQNEEIAKKICYHVNFAKCIYDEREQTLNINTVIE